MNIKIDGYHVTGQFRSMNAYNAVGAVIIDGKYDGMHDMLISYETPVAIVLGVNDGKIKILLNTYYGATTQKQISAFLKWYAETPAVIKRKNEALKKARKDGAEWFEIEI